MMDAIPVAITRSSKTGPEGAPYDRGSRFKSHLSTTSIEKIVQFALIV